jgi:P27 family predicted phage terminase small subunit
MSRRLPGCPEHLTPLAAREWRRVAKALQLAGMLTSFDRAALAAYCQAYGRWAEAEARLRETPMLYKTPSGYVQQSPWLGIVHKQLELMGRYMTELGMTPASRSRVAVVAEPEARPQLGYAPIELRIVRAPNGPEPPSELSIEEWAARHNAEVCN